MTGRIPGDGDRMVARDMPTVAEGMFACSRESMRGDLVRIPVSQLPLASAAPSARAELRRWLSALVTTAPPKRLLTSDSCRCCPRTRGLRWTG